MHSTRKPRSISEDAKSTSYAINATIPMEFQIKTPGYKNIIHALVIAEDHRFWRHRGVDPIGMTRAVYRLARYGKVEGASTIEQQLVRTITQRKEITIGRKIRECKSAIEISSKYEKNLIAFTYLKHAYFGWRANGIDQAAQRLSIDPCLASEREAATLTALLKIPMPRQPGKTHLERHAARMEYILRRWHITQREL